MAKTEGTCPICGKKFFYFPYRGKIKKYCTKACFKKTQKNSLKNETRHCEYCGEPFTPKTRKQTFCCQRCSTLDRKRKTKEGLYTAGNPYGKYQAVNNTWDGDPWDNVKIYDAFNVEIKNARIPDFKLGF